jgi:ligand-binding sensor domain-containing protein/signal transduction histidine kinase
MWFGTDDGLNRFDGYSFKVYRNDPEDPDSLSHNMIMGLVEDSQGYLWIGTYGGGLDRFDPQTQIFTHFRHLPEDPGSLSDDRVRSLILDRSGVLWIATHGGGVSALNPGSSKFDVLGPDPEDPGSAKGWLVDKIYEDREGGLWIGTNDMGLFQYDRDTGQMIRFVNTPDDGRSLSSDILLSAIEEGADGRLWIGSFQGLSALSLDKSRFTQYWHNPDDLQSLSNDTINALLRDHAGHLWIATADGLSRYETNTDSFITYRTDPSDPRSLTGNLIISLYEDRAGDLWIGTRGQGLNRLDRYSARFEHISSRPGEFGALNNNIINAILEDPSGVVWIGTFGGGLNHWDRSTDSWRYYQHDPNNPKSLSHDVVTTLLQDEHGDLWLGTLFGGINRFESSSGTFEHIPIGFSVSEGLNSNALIRAMIQDQVGVLWIGTHGDGLYSFDPNIGSISHYRQDPEQPGSLSGNWVYALLEDDSGAIWIGTRAAGLAKFDRSSGTFEHYVHDPDDPFSLGFGTVNVIFQDQSKTIWVGTEGGGLNRMDRESGLFTRYGSREGFPSDAIYGVQEDDSGWLWVSTGKGLVKFDPQREIIKTYDRRDGLQGEIFVAGASDRAAGGEMYFGGFNGFNVFHPEQIIDNPHVPPIVLTSLTQVGEPMELDVSVERLAEVTLQRPDSHFEFEFAALDFNQSDKNQYAYKLEGYDEQWVQVGTQRFGLYANLPAGSYTLHIIGANNDGLWNETGLTLEINVLPSTWETWWFRAMVGVLVLGITFTAYRLRIRGIEKRSRLLEDQVATRTRELEALNAVATVVSRSFELSAVLQDALEKMLEYTSIQAGAVYLYPENIESQPASLSFVENHLEVKAHIGFNSQELNELEQVVNGEILQNEIEVTNADDLLSDSEYLEKPTLIALGFGHLIAVPLFARKRRLGYLLGNYHNNVVVSEQEQALLASIGLQIGVAVENAQLYAQSQQVAVVEERQRLARDLHDSVTQALYGVMLYSDAAAGQLDRGQVEAAHAHIDNLQETAQQALAEMRLLIHELRPPILEREGLEAAIANRLETVESRAGLKTRFQFDLAHRLDARTEEGLYRITLEALNNALKHADAREILVLLNFDGASLHLEVRDDGVGFDPQSTVMTGCQPCKKEQQRLAGP